MAGLDLALQPLQQRLAEFVVVLEAEAKALEDLQTDSLGPLVDRKNQLAVSVSTAWGRLTEAARGNPVLQEEVERGHSTDPARERVWQDVRRLAKLAEQINATNGQLIEAQLRRTRQALDILQRASSRSNVYGANGQMLDVLGSKSRTFDKA
jgi:flagella synthesis protein FlgN